MLASSDWHGKEYQLRTENCAEDFAYLRETPVHYIVLEMYRPLGDPLTLHCSLLQRTLEEHPHDLVLVARLPRHHGDTTHDHAIVIYENVSARNRTPQSIHVPLERSLGRVLQLNASSDLQWVST
jgi:hypothetical protein